MPWPSASGRKRRNTEAWSKYEKHFGPKIAHTEARQRRPTVSSAASNQIGEILHQFELALKRLCIAAAEEIPKANHICDGMTPKYHMPWLLSSVKRLSPSTIRRWRRLYRSRSACKKHISRVSTWWRRDRATSHSNTLQFLAPRRPRAGNTYNGQRGSRHLFQRSLLWRYSQETT